MRWITCALLVLACLATGIAGVLLYHSLVTQPPQETPTPDVTKDEVSLPPGMSAVSVPMYPREVPALIRPGSRVDILGCVRSETKLLALPVLVHMQVLALDTYYTGPGPGPCQLITEVTFAVDEKQAQVIKLAQARGCDLSLALRGPDSGEADQNYDIDKVIMLLKNKRPEVE